MSEDPIAYRLFNEIGIIDQLAGTLFERSLPKGMTRAQFGVLNHFVRLEPGEKSPATLAGAFQVSRPTMTSTLARLERAGLVRSRPDPADGRAKLISITAAGRQMRARCIAGTDALFARFSEILGTVDVASLTGELEKIRKALDEAR